MRPANGYIVKIRDGGQFRLDEAEDGFIATVPGGDRYKVKGAANVQEAADAFNVQRGGDKRPTGEPIGKPLGDHPNAWQPRDYGRPGMATVESITPDYSAGDYALGAGIFGVTGAAMGGVMGGPVGAGLGGLGGGVGEMVAMGLEEAGGGGGAQFGGSMAAELTTSAILRRPTAGLARRIPGVQKATEAGVEALGKGGPVRRFLSRNWAAEATGYPARQAGKLITDLPSPAPAGADPALEVAESVRSGHQMMDNAYQGARRQAEKETMGMYGRAEPVIRKSEELLERFSYMDEVPKVIKRGADLPGEITLQEAENIRRGVGSAYARGAVDPKVPHYRQAAGLYGPLEEVTDDIAAHSEVGESAVRAMEKMRGARKAMHDAAPETGLMHRYIIGQGRMDNAQKALDRILSSDMAVAEVKKIRGLMEGVGDDIALRRAAVIHVLQRRLGQQAASVAASPQTGGSAISKASSESAALTEILGERGFANLTDLLEDVARGSRGETPFSSSYRGGPMARLLFVLAGGAGAGGTISPEAGAAVLALGGLVEAFMRQNGKEAVANLALSALVDRDVYRLIEMGANVNNVEAAAVRLGQTLVRRGLFTEEELGGDG